jgi:hypothetical protein
MPNLPYEVKDDSVHFTFARQLCNRLRRWTCSALADIELFDGSGVWFVACR